MSRFDAESWMRAEAAAWNARGLGRVLHTSDRVEPGRIQVGERWYWNLASNDYLGLAVDPRVKRAAAEAALEWGAGAGSAALVRGWTRLHESLAARLAEFEQCEAVALFPTGFAANMGAIQTLVSEGDALFVDREVHASIVAGGRCSGARVRIFPHQSTERLERALARERASYRRVLIVTDAVFSMSGEIAPVAELARLAERFEAMLMIDEAHATGILGPGGRGVCAGAGIEDRVTLRVGTLSKALGSLGGFAAGSRVVVDRVLNRAPSFMFSTSMTPSAAAAALAALDITRAEPELRAALDARQLALRQHLQDAGLPALGAGTPIVPILVPDPHQALEASLGLEACGYLVPAIRPPTVPRNTSRLRVSLSAGFPIEQIEPLAQAVSRSRALDSSRTS